MPNDGYRIVGPLQFCLYYKTDAARISFQRGPAFSRGADQGPWDSVVEGCREALGVVDPQVVGSSGENSYSMLGDWLASCCQQRAAAKTWSRSPWMTKTRISRLPASQWGQESPRCHRSSGQTAGLKYWGADLSPRSPVPTAEALISFYDAAP